MTDIKRKWTLKGGYSRGGNWPDEPTRLMTLVESGPTLSMRETVEVVPAEQSRAETDELRAGISWARGMCSDGRPVEEIDHFLGCVLAGHAQLPAASDEKENTDAT